MSRGRDTHRRRPGRTGDTHRRRAGRNALHLLALSAFAVAQPLFAKLGPEPAYFAAHDVGAAGLVAFALALVVVPPLALTAAELVVGLVSARARDALHLAFVAALGALIALPPLGALPTAAAYGLAALAGLAAAVLYARSPRVRELVTAMAVGPLLFLVAFLGLSRSGEAAFGGEDPWAAAGSQRPPVVFIQLDGLSSLMLETGGRRIDGVRFPSLARLARDGVWYRNASNVHENTVFSVSSILDGRLPRKGTKPVVQDHPQNLFTLLGPRYEMNVAEEATSLCPYEYCRDAPGADGTSRLTRLWRDTRVVFNSVVRPEDARASLPSIEDRWSDFGDDTPRSGFETRKKTPEFVIRHLRSGRIGRFERWLAKVADGDGRPALDYIHVFLPHEPREFLPDGRRYPIPDNALESPPSYDKQFLAGQGQQRLLLQIGFTDRLIGRVLERLEQRGLYDEALVVVVADHGESFDVKEAPAGPFVPGRLGFRRAVTRENVEDIASVALFVKYPRGRGPTGEDERYVRTVDILPTIAAALGLGLDRVDGSDLRDPGYRGHDEIRVGTTFGDPLRMAVDEWEDRREASLRRRLAEFGSGEDDLYRWGPQLQALGRRVADFQVHTGPRVVRATIEAPGGFADVRPDGRVCPCLLAGTLTGAGPEPVTIAVAVNGRIAGTGRSFPPVGEKRLAWSVLVPPRAFRRGRNRVEVFRLDGMRLTRLATAP